LDPEQMRERLIAYLLYDLEPAERAALEAELAANPQLQHELEKVRQCLASCDDDPQTGAEIPPPQLASRTCCFVDHAIQKSKSLSHPTAVTKSLSENHEPLVRRQKWSAFDIGAAICVLVALGALIFPSLERSRKDSRLATCQNNMHQLGAALADYSFRFNQGLPQVAANENAGVWVLQLVEKGVLPAKQAEMLVVCPAGELADRVNNGCVKVFVPSRDQYLAATGTERDRMRKYMAGDYAYSMGYRDTQGEIRQVRFSGERVVPLLADAPSSAIAGYQSANHGGCGQNVLFQDLSVKYCKQCKCQKKLDHWFLNDKGQPAAGIHENDMVLGPSNATPVIELITAK
jgi:hypothetical protein